MKLLTLIRNIAFRGSDIKQFLAIKINDRNIFERVVITHDSCSYDITENQWILCQQPFVLGIWVPLSNLTKFDSQPCLLKVTSLDHVKIFCMAELAPLKKIKLKHGHIYLFSMKRTSCFQLNPIKRLLWLKILQHQQRQQLSFTELIKFAAGFSFPRKVILVVYYEEGYHNFFPMDFQGFIEAEGMQVLGLRKTNVTLQKIIENKKILICEVDSIHKDQLYSWGKHHSTSPPALNDIALHPAVSSRFKFPIPLIAKSYKEIEIGDTFDMGSHMLLIGKEISDENYIIEHNPLYHIHAFQFLENSVSGGYYAKI